MSKDIGALGFNSHRQWFAARAGGTSIDPASFGQVQTTFGFRDAVLLETTPESLRRLATFFTSKLQEVAPPDRTPLSSLARKHAGPSPRP